MTRRIEAWWPAAAWAGVLFLLSSLPGSGGPPFLFEGEDKVAHLGLYAVLGVALGRGRHLDRTGSGGLIPWQVPPALGMAWALSDEAHQALVPGRDPSVGDLAADAVGLLLGYWLSSYLLRRRAPGGPAHVTPDPDGAGPE